MVEELAASLEADGYHLSIHVSVVITATPGACEDCLVPKDLMRGILSQELGVRPDSIDIAYPAD
jgi:hypothetical protein